MTREAWAEQTHTIKHGERRIAVHAEEGHEGGLILYTRSEWDACGAADWEQQPDGTVTFQGRDVGALLEVRP